MSNKKIMKIVAPYTLFVLLFLSSVTGLSAQSLWPGDVNNNGVVNGVDLLYLGIAFGSTGPERSDATTDWEAQPVTQLWDQDFPDGINYAFADCNGDGVVDEDDIDEAIEDNFGLRHGDLLPDDYRNGLPGIDPPLVLLPEVAATEPGGTVAVDLALGTAEFPVSDFYGITFSFSYDFDLTAGDDGPDFEEPAEGSWINPPALPKTESLLFTDDTGGTGELAITRTDQRTVDGAGSIGQFIVIIEDIIVGLEIDTFHLRIDSVKLIDRQLNTQVIVPGRSSFLVVRDTNGITATEVVPETDFVRVFPNPARQFFYVESEDPIETIGLYTLTGQRVETLTTSLGPNTARIAPRHPVTGMYLLRTLQGNKIYSTKVLFFGG